MSVNDPVDVYSPDAYVEAPPHDLFARLRREQPVCWQDVPGEAGYWAVLRHADVVHVARNPGLFSASEGGVVIEDLAPESLAQMRDMLLAMDPPRHTAYRKPISPRFKARVIAGLEDRIRAIASSVLDRAVLAASKPPGAVCSGRADGDHKRFEANPTDRDHSGRRASAAGRDGERAAGSTCSGIELEFVHDVCAHLPSQVLGELLGLPRGDWEKIHRLAERNSGGQDPDIADTSERGNSSVEMAVYGMGFAAARRAMPPQGDVTDVLLAQDFDGAPMSDVDFGRFFVQMVTAGNDTTRTMLSSGVLALLQHPEQLDAVRRRPESIPAMIEEVLRWANPLHYFRRTATAETDIAGQRIAAGDKVAMVYTSANRDEAVFNDSQRFDITRDPNPHLSFGLGTHFCLGVHLARLEGRVFFEELLNRFERIELAAPPQRQRSNLNNALKALPVRVFA